MDAVCDGIADPLRHHPELGVFPVLGLGYWIGSFRLGPITLGSVTGSLFAGSVVGQLQIPVSSTARSILFLLFLFGNGYAVGPQFVQSLRGDGAQTSTPALAALQDRCGSPVAVLG